MGNGVRRGAATAAALIAGLLSGCAEEAPDGMAWLDLESDQPFKVTVYRENGRAHLGGEGRGPFTFTFDGGMRCFGARNGRFEVRTPGGRTIAEHDFGDRPVCEHDVLTVNDDGTIDW